MGPVHASFGLVALTFDEAGIRVGMANRLARVMGTMFTIGNDGPVGWDATWSRIESADRAAHSIVLKSRGGAAVRFQVPAASRLDPVEAALRAHDIPVTRVHSTSWTVVRDSPYKNP